MNVISFNAQYKIFKRIECTTFFLVETEAGNVFYFDNIYSYKEYAKCFLETAIIVSVLDCRELQDLCK